jgi:hypothetical protein
VLRLDDSFLPGILNSKLSSFLSSDDVANSKNLSNKDLFLFLIVSVSSNGGAGKTSISLKGSVLKSTIFPLN